MLFQVRTICRDYGVVTIRREGQDVEKIISEDDILSEYSVTFYPFAHYQSKIV